MIKVNKGVVNMDGTGKEIHADVVCIILALFKTIRKEFGTKFAFEVVEKTICIALEELNKLIKEGQKDD